MNKNIIAPDGCKFKVVNDTTVEIVKIEHEVEMLIIDKWVPDDIDIFSRQKDLFIEIYGGSFANNVLYRYFAPLIEQDTAGYIRRVKR